MDKEFLFVFSKMKNKHATKFIVFLGKLAIAPIGQAFAGINTPGAINPKDIDVGEAFNTLARNIDEDAVVDKINGLLSCVTHEGNSVDIDYFAFDGRLDLALDVAKESFVYNFKFFFKRNLAKSERLTKTVQAMKKSAGESKPQA